MKVVLCVGRYMSTYLPTLTINSYQLHLDIFTDTAVIIRMNSSSTFNLAHPSLLLTILPTKSLSTLAQTFMPKSQPTLSQNITPTPTLIYLLP